MVCWFVRGTDADEKDVLKQICDFAHGLVALGLSDSELALMSALVLIDAGIRLFSIYLSLSSAIALWHCLHYGSSWVRVVYKFAVPCTDRPGLKECANVQRLHERIRDALQAEIDRVHGDLHPGVHLKVLEFTQALHELSDKHAAFLNRYKCQHPSADFPQLHKELFSQDGIDAVS
jgi:hypothetical protein